MLLEVSGRAERAMALATEIAHAFRCSVVGPSHVLHGILRVEGAGAVALRNLQVDHRHLRLELERAWSEGSAPAHDGSPRPPDEVLARANIESTQMGTRYIGTEHLLLAVMRQPDAVTERSLRALNVDPGAVIQELGNIFGTMLKRDDDPG
jgi:ATP-dependent Clp protease ATP-binding subunit ClpC